MITRKEILKICKEEKNELINMYSKDLYDIINQERKEAQKDLLEKLDKELFEDVLDEVTIKRNYLKEIYKKLSNKLW